MSRRFITLVLAAATAVSLASTQVRAASAEDIAKIAGGVALLFVLGQVIDDSTARADDDSQKKQTVKQGASHAFNAPAGHNWIERQRPGNAHRQAHSNGRPYPLPPRCRVSLSGADNRKGGLYGRDCLERRYADVKALPRSCKIKINYQNRNFTGYVERCLDQNGFRTPRH